MKNSHIICWFPDKINFIHVFEKFKPETDQALTLAGKGVHGRMKSAGAENFTGQLFFIRFFSLLYSKNYF